MKMKRKSIVLIALMAIFCLALTACGSSDSGDRAGKEKKEKVTYESIYEDYSKKIEKKAPQLVDEYNEEAKSMTSINDRAALADKKVEDLALLSTEGAERMAKLALDNGDDKSVYEDWALKLSDKYMECGKQITDAYMDTCI